MEYTIIKTLECLQGMAIKNVKLFLRCALMGTFREMFWRHTIVLLEDAREVVRVFEDRLYGDLLHTGLRFAQGRRRMAQFQAKQHLIRRASLKTLEEPAKIGRVYMRLGRYVLQRPQGQHLFSNKSADA